MYVDESQFHSTFVPIDDDEGSRHSSNHSSPKSLEHIDLESLCTADIVKIESIDEETSEDGTEIVEAYPISEYTRSNESHWRHMNDNVSEMIRDEALGTSVSTVSSRMTYMDESVHSQNVSEELNEFDVFAKNIALQLNRLPLENALTVQKKIHDLLLAERLAVIRHQNKGRENNAQH